MSSQITQQNGQKTGQNQNMVEKDSEDTFVYQQPTAQDYQYKILINNCNGYIGSQMVEQFRNDHIIEVNPNIICGTLDLSANVKGDIEVDHVIDPKNRTLYNSIVYDSDIIIFSLDNSTSKDFEYLVKLLKEMKLEKKKHIVCVSSLITWNGRKTEFATKGSIDVSYLTKRNSSESHLIILQNQCLALKTHNSNIYPYIVCAGIVYGLGENQLFPHFKKSLQQSQKLRVFGTGKNYLPMVHIEDLSALVYKVVFQHPVDRYHFAVDHSHITQKQLIQTISKNLGNGQYQCVPIEQGFLDPNFQFMTMNIKVQNKPQLNQWISKEGFIQNIGSIISEFNTYRGLKPNKIMIIGQPGAGKTKFSENLQKVYGLPVIDIKTVVQQIKKEEGEYPDKIRQMLEEIKAIKVQQERKAFQQAKKKKKGKGVEQFDPEKIIPRLPDEQIAKIYKLRLQKSDCQNKGYILDGWPKSYTQAQLLFTRKSQQGQSQIQSQLIPNTVFNFETSEEQVKERFKKVAPEQLASTHWTEQHTVRRFQAYNQLNANKSVNSFFEGKVDSKKIQFEYENMQPYTEFIERNGPLGFKQKQQPIQKGVVDEKAEQKPQQKAQKQQGEDQQKEEPDQEFDIQKLKENQKKILNEKSRPIRQYLIDNVIPQITEGLLDICRNNPQDPVLFLIKFLQNKQDLRKNPRK